MKLSFWGFSLTCMILWGVVVFLVGVVNWYTQWYGSAFLYVIDSIYPGYHAMTGGWSVIVGTLYAALDGLLGGMIFAGLYNLLSNCCKKKEA